MIYGIGVDVVDIVRFERSLARAPKLRERLFAESERDRATHSLAARFAAKEALIKALGDDYALGWHDMEVISDDQGAPAFVKSAALVTVFQQLAIASSHVTMSHDAGIATAFVVLERA